MVKRTIIQPWTIFWLSEIISELEWYNPDIKYKRYFKIKCLNCWWEWIKELKDLKKESRPRTCGNCNYWWWKDRGINPWDNYFWYVVIKELPNINWNRRVLVYDLEWNKIEVSYRNLINNKIFDWDYWKYSKTHWMTNTRFYKIYAGILCRCNTVSATHYEYYWWRWIKSEWNNFEDFKKDMYKSYLEHININWESNTSIDRINVNWNYSKDNCKWATKKQQSNNTRRNIIIPKEYKWKTLKEILAEKWVNRNTFYSRIHKWYSFSKALWK